MFKAGWPHRIRSVCGNRKMQIVRTKSLNATIYIDYFRCMRMFLELLLDVEDMETVLITDATSTTKVLSQKVYRYSPHSSWM